MSVFSLVVHARRCHSPENFHKPSILCLTLFVCSLPALVWERVCRREEKRREEKTRGHISHVKGQEFHLLTFIKIRLHHSLKSMIQSLMWCWSFFAHSLHEINGISHLKCSPPSLASIDLLTQTHTLWSSSTFLLSMHRFLSCIAQAYRVPLPAFPLCVCVTREKFSTGARWRVLMISSHDDE